MNSKKILLNFLIVTFLVSCTEDDMKKVVSSEEETNMQTEGNSAQVINGRLYFPTKEDFTIEYETIKEKSEEEIYKKVSRYYGEDFMSLRPM